MSKQILTILKAHPRRAQPPTEGMLEIVSLTSCKSARFLARNHAPFNILETGLPW
jgi:hypothetical protein